jgi:dTDP-4-amino-4,6-dideoxygalactose transaminase
MGWGKWPQYGTEHYAAVDRVIRSGQLFAAKEARALEEFAQNSMREGFVSAVGNATQGLHLALAALDVGTNSEVLVSNYSWISTASAVLMQNAIPVFCDFEINDLGASPTEIEQRITDRTKAVIVTHMLGYQANIEKIARICKSKGLVLIEDCSHAHGGSLFGKPLGTFGDLSVFSLHQRKTVSAGDGGLVWSRLLDIDQKIKRLRSFGDAELSYNYRISEFAAALASVEFTFLPPRTKQRRHATDIFANELLGAPGISPVLPRDPEGASYYALALVLDDTISPLAVDDYLQQCNRLEIPVRKTWEPLNKHPHFNPVIAPARGVPWHRDNNLVGSDPYKDQKFKNSDQFLPNRILEVYFYPGTSEESVLGLVTITKKALIS